MQQSQDVPGSYRCLLCGTEIALADLQTDAHPCVWKIAGGGFIPQDIVGICVKALDRIIDGKQRNGDGWEGNMSKSELQAIARNALREIADDNEQARKALAADRKRYVESWRAGE